MTKAAAPAWGKGPRNPLAPRYSFSKLLLDVTFARILVTLISKPFRSLFAWQLLCGRNIVTFLKSLERALLRQVGWLAASPRHGTLRHLLGSWVDLKRWHFAAAILVAYSAVAAVLRFVRDMKDELLQQKRTLQAKMTASKSYFEWSIHAAKCDALDDGADQEARWRQETRLYDRRLLEEKVSHLRNVRTLGLGVQEQMFAVRADLIRNLGNITNSALHQHFPVVPGPIREYIEEVCRHLQDITAAPDLPLPEKSAFLKETRHAFGRTALVLSGGGPVGAFHLGVIKALLEHNMLPRVLAGSSIGAIVCALAATRPDVELAALLAHPETFDLQFFANGTATQLINHVLFPDTLHMEAERLASRLRHLLGDLTFLQAYTTTGRVLNVSVSTAGAHHDPPRLLNYLTAPNVVIWSAVACSAAPVLGCRGLDLLARDADGQLVRFAAGDDASPTAGGEAAAASAQQRRWRDGSLEDELPLRGLSEMFSVNHFIVCQTNPHIVPFLNLKRAAGTAGALAEAEVKHRCKQLSELLPSWAPIRWLRSFSQPWEGDVTIVPPDTLQQLRKAVTNPTQADLEASVRQGEVCTWTKMSAIHCNCAIEATLDACIQQVGTWERQERRRWQPLKGRVPSLAELRGLTVGHSASVDSLTQFAAAAGKGGAVAALDHDGVWEPAEDHLPLPEERTMLQSATAPGQWLLGSHAPYTAYECIDSSANVLSAFSPASIPYGHSARASLDEPEQRGRGGLDVIAP